MAITPDIGTGIVVTFADSGFTANITDLTPPSSTRGSTPVPHMGTTTFAPKIMHDVPEFGPMSMDIQFNPDVDPPFLYTDQPEVIVITWLGPDDAAGATWTFIGFMSGYEPQCPMEDVMTATVEVTVTDTDVAIVPDA